MHSIAVFLDRFDVWLPNWNTLGVYCVKKNNCESFQVFSPSTVAHMPDNLIQPEKF
jgi:hypothetical protein